ncbi:hypothetical protein [Enterococcus faecium]|uniref:hypothetical protein n=1 Tax=Enterococcus faecium TaxID=1352 RepID=UPI002072DF3D|nr:hypothetical protein [Enterococcus faecium]MCM6879504.1 hypothetical protein [Enterococcus faecium]
MKHKIKITPMNCSFLTGANSFTKMEESEYLSAVDRAIYCKSPDESWFKMKSSVTRTPYLEPTFFGLRSGDVITVEFDAMVISGSVIDFGVSFRSVSGELVNETPVYRQLIPNDALKSHFKHFKIPFVVMPELSGYDGIISNIRSFTNSLHEMIIKNIEIEIETSNLNFSLNDNVVQYKYKRDYLECINLISGTDLKALYNSLKTVYDNGQITFPDIETMSIKSINNKTQFKGLLALLSASKYCQPHAVYLEYKNNSNDASKHFFISSQDYDNDGIPINSEQLNQPTLSLGIWRKAIIYFSGKSGDKRNLILNFGGVSGEKDFDIKNVRFSAPRFDDAIKREPNKLEELYSNLGAKYVIAQNHVDNLATTDEAKTGTNATKIMTPATTAQAIDNRAVTLASNQTVGGIKNFKDGLQIDGVNVATVKNLGSVLQSGSGLTTIQSDKQSAFNEFSYEFERIGDRVFFHARVKTNSTTAVASHVNLLEIPLGFQLPIGWTIAGIPLSVVQWTTPQGEISALVITDSTGKQVVKFATNRVGNHYISGEWRTADSYPKTK